MEQLKFFRSGKDSQQKLHLFVRMSNTTQKGNEQKGSLSSAYCWAEALDLALYY